MGNYTSNYATVVQHYGADSEEAKRLKAIMSGSGQTSAVEPTRADVPEYVAPTFEAPEYNEGEIDALTQKKASPTIRRLRQSYQQAAMQNYENPNVKSMTLRNALQSYGLGSAQTLESAGSAAANEYNQKYSKAYQSALTNFNAKTQAALTNYQTAVNTSQDDYNKAWGLYQQDYEDADEDSTSNFVSMYNLQRSAAGRRGILNQRAAGLI